MARSFKSSGKTTIKQSEETNSIASSEMPIGIMTPLQLGDGRNGTLKMSWNLSDQINDNLKNLILTNWGERLGNYYFGANIKQLTTEIVNQENFDNLAMEQIRSAVARWMPYINLLSFSSVISTDGTNTGKVTINVSYNVANIQEQERMLSVDLYII